jgi:hypothetical protein
MQQGFLDDFRTYLQERMAAFDPTVDTAPGSPFDSQVVEPACRRIGTDPFSTDVPAFVKIRLQQEYPDLAVETCDAITDIILNAFTLLLEPLVRENARVKRSLSFADPSTLTMDEATAIGANIFAEPNTGSVARGVGRIYVTNPQNIRVSPANFFTDRSGLRYFPDGSQQIRAEDMLLNREGTVYYFDVNLVAEQAGDQYNIGPDQLVAISGITTSVRVTNKRSFRDGTVADDAVSFINNAPPSPGRSPRSSASPASAWAMRRCNGTSSSAAVSGRSRPLVCCLVCRRTTRTD